MKTVIRLNGLDAYGLEKSSENISNIIFVQKCISNTLATYILDFYYEKNFVEIEVENRYKYISKSFLIPYSNFIRELNENNLDGELFIRKKFANVISKLYANKEFNLDILEESFISLLLKNSVSVVNKKQKKTNIKIDKSILKGKLKDVFSYIYDEVIKKEDYKRILLRNYIEYIDVKKFKERYVSLMVNQSLDVRLMNEDQEYLNSLIFSNYDHEYILRFGLYKTFNVLPIINDKYTDEYLSSIFTKIGFDSPFE